MAYGLRIRYGSEARDKSDKFGEFILNKKTSLDHRTRFSHFTSPEDDDFLQGNPEFYEAIVYLDDTEDLAQAKQELSEDVFAGVKWYVVHQLESWHDRDEDRECTEWTFVDERGSVPEIYR